MSEERTGDPAFVGDGGALCRTAAFHPVSYPRRPTAGQKYIRALGEEFGREHHAVWNQWCFALNRHGELLELFGTQEKVDVLNAVAPTFFADVQGLFWNDLVLHVARLTDKAGGSLRLQSLERRLNKEDPVDTVLLR